MTTGPYDLFGLLGEFWRQQLSDAELLQFHNFAKLMNGEDALLRYDDLEAAAALKDVVPFLGRQWWLIELLESGLTVEPNVITYGTSDRTYGGGAVYGQTDSQSFAWTVPSQIRSIGLVMDAILEPGVIWDIADFAFDPVTSVLRFDSNPFSRVESELLYNADGSLRPTSIARASPARIAGSSSGSATPSSTRTPPSCATAPSSMSRGPTPRPTSIPSGRHGRCSSRGPALRPCAKASMPPQGSPIPWSERPSRS